MKKIEAKVIAATGGSVGGAGVVSTFVLWLLGITVWGVPWTADKASEAIGAVPGPVQVLTVAVIGGLITFIAGYTAPHTNQEPTPPVV